MEQTHTRFVGGVCGFAATLQVFNATAAIDSVGTDLEPSGHFPLRLRELEVESLTVAEFAARYGPTQEDYDALIHFAEANGLTVVGTSRNRVNLDVAGSIANDKHERIYIHRDSQVADQRQ